MNRKYGNEKKKVQKWEVLQKIRMTRHVRIWDGFRSEIKLFVPLRRLPRSLWPLRLGVCVLKGAARWEAGAGHDRRRQYSPPYPAIGASPRPFFNHFHSPLLFKTLPALQPSPSIQALSRSRSIALRPLQHGLGPTTGWNSLPQQKRSQGGGWFRQRGNFWPWCQGGARASCHHGQWSNWEVLSHSMHFDSNLLPTPMILLPPWNVRCLIWHVRLSSDFYFGIRPLIILLIPHFFSAADWRYAAGQFVNKLPDKVIVHRKRLLFPHHLSIRFVGLLVGYLLLLKFNGVYAFDVIIF